ncbi:MAG: S41 family peptidase [Bacteroidetes bacterium]|nr:S41 family peptidase [Bacteroidota bacterium]
MPNLQNLEPSEPENFKNSSKKTKHFIMPLVFALLLATGIVIGYFYNFNTESVNTNETNNRSQYKNKINSLLDFIQMQYVDSVDINKLENKAIAKLLKGLDPHSDYIPAEDLKEINEPLEGNFDGVGIEFNIFNDTVRVVNPIPGGPSEKLGIKSGDKIIKVNSEIIAGKKISNKDVFKKLRGKSGSFVNVSIMRGGVNHLIEYKIERGKIPIYSIDVAYMLTKNIGYIKISRFAETTYDEYIKAFNHLSSKGMQKLVLDLRDNGGGFLKIAVQLADEFLTNGLHIVYTQGRTHPKKLYTATNSGGFESKPLTVLIDEGSASASEILAGALQDNDRATIIGRRSFGKGLVQDQVELNDGSAVRLTIARYYTPTGRCIQKPYSDNLDDYYNEEFERFKHGELYNADSMKLDKSKSYKTPAGKIVYGGGGIVPDVFIPLDSNKYSKNLNHLFYNGVLNNFAFEYTDKNRSQFLKEFSNANIFIANFKISNKEIDAMNLYLASKKLDKFKLNLTDKGLTLLLKALIGRNLFDKDAYFPIINSDDSFIKHAIEILDKQK